MKPMIDYEALREALRDECFAAYLWRGHRPGPDGRAERGRHEP